MYYSPDFVLAHSWSYDKTDEAHLLVEHSYMLSLGWHVTTRAAPLCWHVNLGTTYLNVPHATVHHLYNGTAHLNVEYCAYQSEMVLSLSLPTWISAPSHRLMSVSATSHHNTFRLQNQLAIPTLAFHCYYACGWTTYYERLFKAPRVIQRNDWPVRLQSYRHLPLVPSMTLLTRLVNFLRPTDMCAVLCWIFERRLTPSII